MTPKKRRQKNNYKFVTTNLFDSFYNDYFECKNCIYVTKNLSHTKLYYWSNKLEFLKLKVKNFKTKKKLNEYY